MDLFRLSRYPDDYLGLPQLYDTSTKLIRYLFQKYPAELFPKFVDGMLAGASAPSALVEIYGDEFRDMSAFQKKFETLIR